MRMKPLQKSLLAIVISAPLFAHAEFGIYAKGGTFGLGGGIGYGFNDMLTARLGYTAFDYDLDIDTDDVNYDGKAKIGGGEFVLDWHPFSGTFRLTAGLIANRNKIDVDAKTSQPVTVNGTTYTPSQLGSLKGTVDFKSTAPYFGIGWGNVAGKDGNFHFIADIGVVFQGSPDVKLKGTCGSALNASQCNQLQSNVQAEEDDLNDEVSDYKHWPVINFGVGYRF